jgi:hypothetical protein
MKLKSIKMLLLFTGMSFFAQAQQQQQVDVKYWGGRALLLVPRYWEPVQGQLKGQISDSLFTYIRQHCSEKGWPEFFRYQSDDTSSLQQEQVFDKLIKYRVATYDNIRNGENYGREAILRVPWLENQHVHSIEGWDYDIYFIVPDKDVVPHPSTRQPIAP